jgi:hypothetical protein
MSTNGWTYEVHDVKGNKVGLGIHAAGGFVIVNGPRWYKTDPDNADWIDLGYRAAADRARQQRLDSRRS